jgi:dihydrodipicolinate synthase/N-acetylneuraminate lyase
MTPSLPNPIRESISRGLVIPACPLALNASRRLDEHRQRALFRYYAAAGAGGFAVGVHTTQFAIRDPRIGLFEPLLTLAAEEASRTDSQRPVPLARIGGVCGTTSGAVAEAELLLRLGYHAGLLSLAALKNESDDALVRHCRAVGAIIPLIGFYLQPAAGGRILSHSFWRQFVEIESVCAIKIAPFNRYQTLDVVRAVTESGRNDVVLYTGNDDSIVADLLTPFRCVAGGAEKELRIVGGLLGHWSVWTRRAVELIEECRGATATGGAIPPGLLAKGMQITDCNAAFFDVANGFRGCIAGLHEVLRRQGLFEGIWCLDPAEGLSPGQNDEITRVCRSYPELNDDAFVAAHLDQWLR